jgi:hypothetical protein
VFGGKRPTLNTVARENRFQPRLRVAIFFLIMIKRIGPKSAKRFSDKSDA